MTEATAEPTFSPLLADILSANARTTADATNRVIDSLRQQLDYAHARAALVEERMVRLLDGPWMPTSQALLDALYPSDEKIRARAATEVAQ